MTSVWSVQYVEIIHGHDESHRVGDEFYATEAQAQAIVDAREAERIAKERAEYDFRVQEGRRKDTEHYALVAAGLRQPREPWTPSEFVPGYAHYFVEEHDVVLPACSCGAPATHDENPVVAELYPGQDPREFLCDACFDELAGDI